MKIRFFCYFKVLCTLTTLSFVYLFQCHNMCVDGFYRLYGIQEIGPVVRFHYHYFLFALWNVSQTCVFSSSILELEYLPTTDTLLGFVIVHQVIWETWLSSRIANTNKFIILLVLLQEGLHVSVTKRLLGLIASQVLVWMQCLWCLENEFLLALKALV